jgi:predicted CoA-binding protein
VIEAETVLASARSVLLVDWPSRDVPDTLAGAGYRVVVKAGLGPAEFAEQQPSEGTFVSHPIGRPRERFELVYAHRPLAELPEIIALAKEFGAKAVWYQSGLDGDGAKDPKGCSVPQQASREARDLVESAGLSYADEQYIADVVRSLGMHR